MPPAYLTAHRSPALRLAIVAAVTGALLVGGALALRQEERQLIFRADRDAARWFSGLPAGIQEFELPVGSGPSVQHIHAWWWPAARADAPAVLYLHGARWNLTGQLFRIQQLRDFGFSVLAIDYRGFGKSDGDLPSESTAYQDARAAWDWLAAQRPDPAKRFIYGHSLGGAVAVDLAAALSGNNGDASGAVPSAYSTAKPGLGLTATANGTPAGGLIIESTFTTLVDMAKELTYPWLPIGLLMSQKFDSVGKMANVRMPVLVVHGAGDRYVPSRFGEALYAAATGPKKLLLIDGASHNNSMFTGADNYRLAIGELFGLGADTAAKLGARTPARRERGRS
jgi:alpha-beta hydrolase superfamily lysophospholipase